MNVLVTGGAGYIGYSLIEQLIHLAEVEQITIYDNLSRASVGLFYAPVLRSPKLRFVEGDLLDSRKLRAELRRVQGVYHLAGKVSAPFADIDSHYFEQVNHWGTAQLAELIEETATVDFLVYLSSVAVYGYADEVATEDTFPSPNTFYGVSKLRGEGHIQRLLPRLHKGYIIRAGNVYGYNAAMRLDAVINRFLFEANYKNRISIHGNGNQKRAFIHIDKLCLLLSQLLTTPLTNGIYNVAEHTLSVNEISDTLKELYPTLETLYINQHLPMPRIEIATPNRIAEFIHYPSKPFLAELEEFKQRFTF